ncbi:glycosyltransferase [Cellulomonas sp. CW35]|uniref:Glycosyltransferase subfamily 4-like N-terminal domain-containing protein n=1 Tax=Cellulomonas uda TaxID=1714 RepID=A0A4Y3K5N7_CELUD|nr:MULTISPECIES: glycosyltransferase [Cellulomonas]ASR55039.1 hypothetical protein CBP52_07980 [Cellulomonas sp. PSBB021]NII65290.1 glycosyltransferase involved in cell wall biosynthesis [Cellulomonas uda]GEA79809.1 hypothetical protein CUD01_02530 [Cellulomonas uda]
MVHDGRRPHVLLVALYYPPSRASGVFRPLAMANHFAASGWDVTVVTVTEDFFDRVVGSRDDSLLATVDPRVHVVRVPLPMSHLDPDLRHRGRLATTLPFVHRALTIAGQKYVFPEQYGSWVLPVANAIGRVHRHHPVDVVVATGNPWSDFAAAYAAHVRHRIPYVMDYRDSWTLDLFEETDAFPPGHLARRWESRLIGSAARVTFVNEALRHWHAERYPAAADRMRVLPNGYDADLLGEPGFRSPEPGAPLRFGFIGTVTDRHPHDAMWEGWKLARRDPAMAGATAHVYGHLGFFAGQADRIRALLPLDENVGVTYEGPVSKATIGKVYDDLDAILLMAADSRYVTSGKVFECMASGKPITGVFSPTTAIAEPLAGYPLAWSAAELTPQGVADALVATARGAREQTAGQHVDALVHARTYRRDALLEPFVAEVAEVAGA